MTQTTHLVSDVPFIPPTTGIGNGVEIGELPKALSYILVIRTISKISQSIFNHVFANCSIYARGAVYGEHLAPKVMMNFMNIFVKNNLKKMS